MDTQRLKDKILQLAIQGKLVEQDKNDEPASALLQRIKEERDKLVREGKIRKPKKLAPIEEEEKPFDIPKGWEWVRLGEVIEIIGGVSYKKGDVLVDNFGMRVLRGGNIQNNSLILYDDDVYINKDSIAKEKIIREGDIIIVASTGSKTVIGKPAFIEKDYENIAIGAFLRIIRPINILNSKYISKIFFSGIYRNYIRNISKGTNINNVKNEYLNNFIIPLPPLAEQKRIVEKVDQLFTLIDELDSNKEDLLEVINLTRNQVLQEAIQGKLVEQNPEDEPASVLLERIKEERNKLIKEKKIRKPKKLPPIEEEKPFEIPKGWEWVRLGEISSQIPSKQYQIKQSDIIKEGRYPVVSQSINLIEGYSNVEDKLLMIDNPVVIFGDHTRHVKYIDFNFIVGADGIKIINPLEFMIGFFIYLFYIMH